MITYNIYASPAPGEPIDYSSPVATVSGTSWAAVLSVVSGTTSFGVRAANENGEEQNLDCSASIAFDAGGNDVSNVPAPPVGLRAFATANAGIRVEWAYPPTTGPKAPAGFNVYTGIGTPNYASPAKTVAANIAILGGYQVNVSGVSGYSYVIGVRAYNSYGEETNTSTVAVVASGTGPLPVAGLTANPVS